MSTQRDVIHPESEGAGPPPRDPHRGRMGLEHQLCEEARHKNQAQRGHGWEGPGTGRSWRQSRAVVTGWGASVQAGLLSRGMKMLQNGCCEV